MSMKKLAERLVGKGWIEPIATPPAAALAEHESLKGHAFYLYRGQCYSSMKKLAERWLAESLKSKGQINRIGWKK